MLFTQWNVYVVYWGHDPAAEIEGKRRPAVLVSTTDQILQGQYIFLKISSQESPQLSPPTIRMCPDHDGADFMASGLKTRSWIYFADWQIISEPNVLRRVGWLTENYASLLKDKLRGN